MAAAVRALLPGPFTLVVPNPGRRYSWLSAARPDVIGVRAPALPEPAAEIVERVGMIVATSANVPGGSDPRRLDDVPDEILAGVAFLGRRRSVAGRSFDGDRPLRGYTGRAARGRRRSGRGARSARSDTHRIVTGRRRHPYGRGIASTHGPVSPLRPARRRSRRRSDRRLRRRGRCARCDHRNGERGRRHIGHPQRHRQPEWCCYRLVVRVRHFGGLWIEDGDDCGGAGSTNVAVSKSLERT